LQTAMAESGDLLYPADHGLLRWGQVEELGDVIVGRAAVPDFSSGIIVFESHGLAMQDVAVAALAYELACVQGIGRPIAL
jgi:alanine dehydrogenase